ncbi:carboxylesterase [Holotrichia oblita]|uniref:Carboxylesterase n=1 Tax=Holotrichia oblita TaxID=644536 RepID=A0ACB9SRM5_HOLOL|nr:carboxylesterase [Holotrichia oblita]
MKFVCKNVYTFVLLYVHATFATLDSQFYVTGTFNGLVKGLKQTTITSNKPYYAYLGVPFANPPVGNLRFEPPQPVDNWSGILDATKQRDVCNQGVMLSIKAFKMLGSEDCLYLNIYTPISPQDVANEQPRSVMVWIYGGGFFEGDNTHDLYNPDLFLDQDIVVVSIAYRLGILGFFSTGDMVQPGNNGLKDQILALKWIKNNIRTFGGDPESITIFGESVGAGSVSFLTETPLTNGLYHRAIMQSGTSHCPWAINTRPREVAYHIADLLGINATSNQDLKDQLKSIDAVQLQAMSITGTFQLLGQKAFGGLTAAPVIEPDHPNAVITKFPYYRLKSGEFNQVPMMIGYNSMEVIDFVLLPLFHSYLNNIGLASQNLVPISFHLTDPTSLQIVGDALKQYYFGNLSSVAFTDFQAIPFLSDLYFVINIIETAELASKYTDVFLYELSFLSQLGNPLRPYTIGVGHAEDLNYLFTRITSPPVITTPEALTQARMIKLWTNFAKFGNPTPDEDELLQNVKWRKIDENLNYLDIGENLNVSVNPHQNQYTFWMNLYSKYRQLN